MIECKLELNIINSHSWVRKSADYKMYQININRGFIIMETQVMTETLYVFHQFNVILAMALN